MCDDNGSDESDDVTHCITYVYLAVLYYVSKQYETAKKHCELATREKLSSTQRYSYLVEGRLKTTSINALGLVVLH